MTERPARVNDLVSWVERVHVESELARQQARNVVELLSEITESKFEGTAVEAYSRFIAALEESETQAEALRAAVTPMKASAEPVFDQWEKDLAQFASPSMRSKSESRMQRTKDRYEDVVRSVDPAQTALDSLNRSLRDHALFLSSDFNAHSIALIREDVSDLTGVADDLSGRFDLCLDAAQEYVNNYALPSNSSVAAPSPGPGGGSAASDRGR